MLMQELYNTIECGGWLVPVVTHAHPGDDLDVFYYFCDKPNPSDCLDIYAVTPEGKRQYLEMISRGEDHCTYRIQIKEKGLYHLVAEQARFISLDAEGRWFSGTFEDNPEAVFATRSLHYAHTVLQSGKGLESSGRSQFLLPPLCIVPDNWNSFRVGEVLALTPIIMDTPLPLYDIDIYRFSENGQVIREKRISNGSGRMLYPLNKPGKYIIAVSYNSPEYKEGSYYDTVYTYSFWFNARS